MSELAEIPCVCVLTPAGDEVWWPVEDLRTNPPTPPVVIVKHRYPAPEPVVRVAKAEDFYPLATEFRDAPPLSDAQKAFSQAERWAFHNPRRSGKTEAFERLMREALRRNPDMGFHWTGRKF